MPSLDVCLLNGHEIQVEINNFDISLKDLKLCLLKKDIGGLTFDEICLMDKMEQSLKDDTKTLTEHGLNLKNNFLMFTLTDKIKFAKAVKDAPKALLFHEAKPKLQDVSKRRFIFKPFKK